MCVRETVLECKKVLLLFIVGFSRSGRVFLEVNIYILDWIILSNELASEASQTYKFSICKPLKSYLTDQQNCNFRKRGAEVDIAHALFSQRVRSRT